MKTALLILASVFAVALPASAQFKDTELKVSPRTLDREKKINRPKQEELTRGLKITVKNTSNQPLGEGEIEWAILVQRPSGQRKALLSTGKEKLPPLKAAEVVTFNVGAIAVQDTGTTRQEMEYQVIVHRGGIQVAKAESTPKFSQMAESARGAKKKGEGTGKAK